MRDLNYQLKLLCKHSHEGSFETRVGRERQLSAIANQLHDLGFRQLKATSLKKKACPDPGGPVAQTKPLPWHHQEPDELFALVSQDPVESLPRFTGYDVLVLNAGDDPDRTTAAATDLDVDTEHTF